MIASVQVKLSGFMLSGDEKWKGEQKAGRLKGVYFRFAPVAHAADAHFTSCDAKASPFTPNDCTLDTRRRSGADTGWAPTKVVAWFESG